MPYRPWTQEEIELLVAKKKVPTRSKKSIRMKLVNLGLKKPKFKIKPHKKISWTAEEIELLKQNKNIPNRTKESIRNMMFRLNLMKKGEYKKPWKKKEEKLLKSLVKQSHTALTIFNMGVLPYSRNSIQKKMCYMGLAKKSPIRNILSKEDRAKFKIFLQENYVGKTPQDLADLWNQKNNKKVNKGRAIYHLANLKIKVSYGEVQRINHQKKKEEIIKTSIHRNTKVMDENIRIVRMKMMRARVLQGKDIWTGLETTENIEEITENIEI
jgi:hypothetical protein